MHISELLDIVTRLIVDLSRVQFIRAWATGISAMIAANIQKYTISTVTQTIVPLK